MVPGLLTLATPCSTATDAAARRQRPASTSYALLPAATLQPRQRRQAAQRAAAAAGCAPAGSSSPAPPRRQRRRQQRRAAARPDEAQASRDEGAGAGGGSGGTVVDATAEREALKSLELLEVTEPAVEERAESAALAVAAAVAFGAGVWAVLGRQKGEEYFAGYLLEQVRWGGAGSCACPFCVRACASVDNAWGCRRPVLPRWVLETQGVEAAAA